MIKLEDVLTDKEIDRAYCADPGDYRTSVRRCIALAVEKWPEKVSGWVHTEVLPGGKFGHKGRAIMWNDKWTAGPARHALLLLGPKYEPKPAPCPTCGEVKHSGSRMMATKPVKSAEELVRDALKYADDHRHIYPDGDKPCTCCAMARILRGEEGR